MPPDHRKLILHLKYIWAATFPLECSLPNMLTDDMLLQNQLYHVDLQKNLLVAFLSQGLQGTSLYQIVQLSLWWLFLSNLSIIWNCDSVIFI